MDYQSMLGRLREYETVIDTMHCGLLVEDLNGIVVFANKRMLDWLGYAKDEVEGNHVTMLAPPELKDLITEDMDAAKKGDLRARLMAIRRKDSTTFPVITLPQQFLDATGEHDGYFYVVVDMGAVMTAKPVGPGPAADLRAALGRIATELQSISLWANLRSSSDVPLGHADLEGLSAREKEVLALLLEGQRVPTIGDALHISPHTVRNHLKAMFRKLGVRSQGDLIARVRAMAAPQA